MSRLRLVVVVVGGTANHGVFRGSAIGRCVAPSGPVVAALTALTVGPTGGFVALNDSIRTLAP